MMRHLAVFFLCFSTGIALQCYSYVSTEIVEDPSPNDMKLVNCNSNACMSYTATRPLAMDGVTYRAGTTYGCSDTFGAESCGTTVKSCVTVGGIYSKCCCNFDKCNGRGVETATKYASIAKTFFTIFPIFVTLL